MYKISYNLRELWFYISRMINDQILFFRIFSVLTVLIFGLDQQALARKKDDNLTLEIPDSIQIHQSFLRKNEGETPTDHTIYIQIANQLGAYFLKVHQLDSAEKYLKMARQRCILSSDSSSLLRATSEYLLGEYYLDDFNKTDARLHFQIAHDIRFNLLGTDHPETAMALLGLGKVNIFITHNYSKAEETLGLVMDKLKNHTDTDSSYFANLYYYMGVLFSDQSQFTDAFWYGNAALTLSMRLPEQDHAFVAKCHNSLAIAYYRDLQKSLAINHFREAIKHRQMFDGYSNERTALYYINIATCYRELGEFDKAQEYNQKALNIYQISGQSRQGISSCYYNSGVYNLLLREYDSAIFYLKRSIKPKGSAGIMSGLPIARAFVNLGKAMVGKQQLDSALNYYQKAWGVINPEAKASQPLAGLDSIPSNHVPMAHEILVNKGATLFKIYSNVNGSKGAISALKCFLSADSIMINVWRDFKDVPSKLHLSTHLQDAQELTLELLYQLYSHSENSEYARKALEIIERNKQRVLMENLVYMHSNQIEMADDSLLVIERSAQKQVLYLRHLFELERHKDQPDPLRQQQLHSQVVDATRKLIQVKDILRARMTKRTFRNAEISFEENVAYLEYFWGNRAVYGCVIKNDQWHLFKIENKVELEKQVSTFNMLIQNGLNISTLEQDYLAYTNNGYSLYQQLIQPAEEVLNKGQETSKTKLVLIPDGFLASLSFGALLVSVNHKEKADYLSLPYLLGKYSLNYSYSLNFLQLHQRQKREGQNLLGFAYSGPGGPDQKEKDAYSEGLALPGSTNEINSIASIWKGDYYGGTEANLKRFKDLAPQYDILHIAIHGKADMMNASNNMLLFPSADQKYHSQDTLLSYEIPGLGLNAQLVVLSACETGIGKSFKGEGTYSIARSFAMGGCPSIVTSLWNVNDVPTSQLMAIFYSELKSGKSINGALRTAQLEYLGKADKLSAHPANWAGFISLGDSSKVLNGPTPPLWNIVMGMIAVLTLIVGPRLFKRFRTYS